MSTPHQLVTRTTGDGGFCETCGFGERDPCSPEQLMEHWVQSFRRGQEWVSQPSRLVKLDSARESEQKAPEATATAATTGEVASPSTTSTPSGTSGAGSTTTSWTSTSGPTPAPASSEGVEWVAYGATDKGLKIPRCVKCKQSKFLRTNGICYVCT